MKKEIVDIIQSHLLDIVVAGMVLDEAKLSEISYSMKNTSDLHFAAAVKRKAAVFFSLSVRKKK